MSNCLIGDPFESTKCLSCKDGYLVKEADQTCEDVVTDCHSYNKNGSCFACKKGFKLNLETKNCEAVTHSNC